MSDLRFLTNLETLGSNVKIVTYLSPIKNKIFLPRFYNWPETVHVDLVNREGELAFVPKSPTSSSTTYIDTSSTHILSYELEDGAATKEYRGTERVDYSIWVDFIGN
uniref:Uncharacterized protein n=1 Tax=Leersia perrieri TaxID=77586 RepID=A0A0D9XDC5_9ORYZ